MGVGTYRSAFRVSRYLKDILPFLATLTKNDNVHATTVPVQRSSNGPLYRPVPKKASGERSRIMA